MPHFGYRGSSLCLRCWNWPNTQVVGGRASIWALKLRMHGHNIRMSSVPQCLSPEYLPGSPKRAAALVAEVATTTQEIKFVKWWATSQSRLISSKVFNASELMKLCASLEMLDHSRMEERNPWSIHRYNLSKWNTLVIDRSSQVGPTS